jgi:hypothetical protein
VTPIINLIENNIILFEDKENTKHDIKFSNKIIEQTLLGPNLEKIKLTKILANDKPK